MLPTSMKSRDPGVQVMSARIRERIARRAAGALLVAALVVPIAAAGHRAPAQNATIRLVVDYGDGVIKTVTGLLWSKGSTVLDVMNAAKAHPHGITFSYTGSGDAAFLTRIDDVANEGGGAGRKSWQLWVNTAYADRSFGVYEVQAFDVVYWRFTTKEGK
jgi:hypothetical protein